MRLIVYLLVLVLSLSFRRNAADFSLEIKEFAKEKKRLIGLIGEIVEGDYKEYLDFFNLMNKKDRIVWGLILNSKGGLVSEAIKIGHHARKNGLGMVVLGNDDVCYSSCSLIWFSGLTRANNGKLGVHRSYLKNAGKMSFSEMEDNLGSNHKIIQEYLVEMRVPATIIEDFMATSSTEIKLIEGNKALIMDRLFKKKNSNGSSDPHVETKGPDWWACYNNYAAKLSEGDPSMGGRLIEKKEVKFYNLNDTTKNLCRKWDQHRKDWREGKIPSSSTNPLRKQWKAYRVETMNTVKRELQFGK